MVNYASKCFDALEALEMAHNISMKIYSDRLWQEYVENAS
jgi:hypothetical protein